MACILPHPKGRIIQSKIEKKRKTEMEEETSGKDGQEANLGERRERRKKCAKAKKTRGK